MSAPRLAALTIAALFGFAANSLLCRAAIGAREIDPATFTAIRLLAGALVLAVLARIASATSANPTSTNPTSTNPTSTNPTSTNPTSTNPTSTNMMARGSWISALALFVYAAAFSFAYVRLTTATGALLLFASVQLSMIGAGIARGERPRGIEWLGHATAIGGLVALASPGLEAPDPVGAVLMAIAGAAWGVYSLRGRGAKNPLAVTADNFARTVPMALVLVVIAAGVALLLVDAGSASSGVDGVGSAGAAGGGIDGAGSGAGDGAGSGAGGAGSGAGDRAGSGAGATGDLNGEMATSAILYTSVFGVMLAVASGAIASGVGYSLWYAALPSLPATRAAVVQLSVPAIAAAGGVVVLGEAMTMRFVVCAATILGGVAIAILGRRRS
jgi:drug/metabolite transporter (DMT)-like permease